MSKEKFIAVGHITNDLRPQSHLGGAVSYSAVTAARLGLEAHVVTKCPVGHPYINTLENLNVEVHNLPSSSDTITTFDNKYGTQEKRTQIVSQIQESISQRDQKNMPWSIFKNAIVLIAPVTPFDVSLGLFSDLAKYKNINVAAQGYFRRINRNGVVIQDESSDFNEPYLKAKSIILSDEDISVGNLNKIKSPLVVLTQGAKGVTVYEKGEKILSAEAFSLAKEELVDFTGAGDVFATIFIVEMAKNGGDIKSATVAACLFAAMKITAMGGIGMDSIPSQKQTKDFFEKHEKQVRTYLKNQNSKYPQFLKRN